MVKKSITSKLYRTVEATLVQTNGSYRVKPTVRIVAMPRTDRYEFDTHEGYDPEESVNGGT